jgi:hypothetical protein
MTAAPESAPLLTVDPTLRTAAGAPSTIRATVTNVAAAPRVVTVMVLGLEPGWAQAGASSGVLAPGESQVVELRVVPPVGTFPAQYPFAVTAQAVDPDADTRAGATAESAPGVAQSVLVVNPRTQLAIDLNPRELVTRHGGALSVTLRNTGTEAVPVDLSTTASRGVHVRLRRTHVEVGPGEVVKVRGRVSANRRNRVGATHRHTFTVTAAGPAVVRRLDGTLTQKAVVGPAAMRLVALALVLGVWLTAAVVFIPKLADSVRPDREQTTTVAGTGAEGASDDGGSGGGSEGSGDAGGDSGGSGSDGSGDGAGGAAGGGTQAQNAAARTAPQLQLTGTVTAADPGGVTVSLEPTSLVDEAAQGAQAVGVDSVALAASGMSSSQAFALTVPRETPTTRSASTTDDGSWSFPSIASPGYYLLTFSKPGYQTQKFVVDSGSESAGEPLTVDLQPGEGSLQGRVSGPRGPVGGATITLTDGTSTITTSTVTKGDGVGRWSVEGLSTPATYVVTAARDGLSTESEQVQLAAGGNADSSLSLRTGVGTLSGKVSGTRANGSRGGLGGIDVTVTDGADLVRHTTTFTGDTVGRYTVPDLPVPGTYTVSVSGQGYQTQVSTVAFKRGDGGETLDIDPLTASTGVVTGHVTSSEGKNLVGAGQVLASDDHTYKTTTTSADPGSYRFSGVSPGTYTLTTQLFGYVTDSVTVEVAAGGTVEEDRTLDVQPGGVLPATSRITGRALDFETNDVLNACENDSDQCLRATVEASAIQADGTEKAVTYTATFARGEQYTLPPASSGVGLLPGVHQVLVTAPHHLPGTVDVEVPQASTVTADPVRLRRAPKVSGTLGTVVTEQPKYPTCVYVVPGPEGTAKAPTVAQCETDLKAQQCVRKDAPYDGTPVTAAATRCVSVATVGDYSVEVPVTGTYTVFTVPTDENFKPTSGRQVVLAAGDSVDYDPVIDRFGQLTVTVLVPGDNNQLTVATTSSVALGTGPAQPTTQGTWVSGPLDAATYTVAATNSATGTGATRTGTRDVYVGLNSDVSVLVPMINKITAVTGRLTTVLDGVETGVSGARVDVTAPRDYVDVNPVNGSVSATTNTVGCFAVVPDTQAPAGIAPCAGSNVPSGTAVASGAGFVSETASSITLTATGYKQIVLSNRKLDTRGLNEFTLEPLSVRQTLTATTNPGTAVDWRNATVSVTARDGSPVSAALRNPPGATLGTTGTFVWADPRYPDGTVRPGTYTVSVSLPGHDSLTRTVTCAVAGTCGFTEPVAQPLTQSMTLQRHGAIQVSVVDRSGAHLPLTGAEVTLLTSTGATVPTARVLSTGGGNSVTFGDLSPADTQTYTLLVKAPGAASVETTTISSTWELSCTPAATTGKIDVQSGTTTTCTVGTDRLGTITGEVRGIVAAAPNTTPYRTLGQTQVTATRCTKEVLDGATRWCTELDADDVFTTTTGTNGRFTLTGTLARAGLTSGTWLLTSGATGFAPEALPASAPAGAIRGTVVPLGAGATADTTVAVRATPVQFTVHLQDSARAAVEKASVVLRQAGLSDLTAVESTTTPGDYVVSAVVPGSYTVIASGPGLITSTLYVAVPEGTTASVYMPIGRGANTLVGQVTGGSPSGPLDAAVVELRCDASSSYGATRCPAGKPALGTNGSPMTFTTGANGRYEFRNVPDGPYVLRVVAHSFKTATSSTLTFDHELGAVPPQDVALVGVARNTTLTVTSSRTSDPLSGAAVTLTRGSATLNGTLSGSGGTTTATFNQVPAGCWTVDLTLPTNHHGDVSALSQPAGQADAKLSCAAGTLQISGEDTSTDATASLTVDEAEVTVTSSATALTGHTAPGTVAVSVRHQGGATVWSQTASPGTSPQLWLAPGTYVAQVAPPTGFTAAFWPAVEQTFTVTRTSGSSPSVTLAEVTRNATVTVDGLPTGQEATITVTAGSGQTATVTGSRTTSGGTVTLALPEGAWKISATSAGGTIADDDYTMTATSGGIRLTYVADPPPPSPTPTPTPTPTTP